MGDVFCWSDGWSWNASILFQGSWWLASAVILGVFITVASILVDASGAANAKRRQDSDESARTWSHSSTSSCRDIRKIPLGESSKAELRELIADMRIRHSDQMTAVLALLPDEQRLDMLLRKYS